MDTLRDREFSRLVAIELAAEAKRRDIKQRDLASAAGVGAPAFSNYVQGRRGLMTVGTLLRACEALGIDPETVVQRAYDALTTNDGPAATSVSEADGYVLAARDDDDDDVAAAHAEGGW